jgi:hypothetical protein
LGGETISFKKKTLVIVGEHDLQQHPEIVEGNNQQAPTLNTSTSQDISEDISELTLSDSTNSLNISTSHNSKPSGIEGTLFITNFRIFFVRDANPKVKFPRIFHNLWDIFI